MFYQQEAVGGGFEQATVVRDDNQRALKTLQCERECVAHVQIEMVGRFVQQQQIRLLPHNHCQRQPRLFAAGKRFGFLQGGIADKVEAAEEVADFLFAHVGAEFLDVPQRTLVGTQGVELVLGEITDIELVRADNPAGQDIQFARQRFDKGRFAAAVYPQKAVTRAAFQRQVDAVQNGLAAVAQIGFVQLQQRIGQVGGAVEFKRKPAVEVCRRDAFELVQGLHAALRLHGFGGLGFESVDKGLQVFDLRLLFEVGRLLLCQAAGAFGLVKIVIAAVKRELLIGKFDGLRRGGVEEIAVVRNDDLGTWQAGQMVFQP